MIHTIELKQGENHVDERLSFRAYLTSKPRCVIHGAVQVPDDSTQSYRSPTGHQAGLVHTPRRGSSTGFRNSESLEVRQHRAAQRILKANDASLRIPDHRKSPR